jgi:hypothetical protein
VTGKDIEIKRGQNSVAQAVLLDQETRIVAGQRRVPGAPFVNDERDLISEADA